MGPKPANGEEALMEIILNESPHLNLEQLSQLQKQWEEEFQEFQYNLAYQSTCWSKLKSKFIPCAHHTLLLNDKPPILRLDLTVKVRCLDPE